MREARFPDARPSHTHRRRCPSERVAQRLRGVLKGWRLGIRRSGRRSCAPGRWAERSQAAFALRGRVKQAGAAAWRAAIRLGVRFLERYAGRERSMTATIELSASQMYVIIANLTWGFEFEVEPAGALE